MTSPNLHRALGLPNFRNKIINGGFDIWQRGTSFPVAAGTVPYTADRWNAFTQSGAATVSFNPLAGSALGNGQATSSLTWQQTTAASSGHSVRLAQYIEHVATLSGRQVTISFDAVRTGGGAGFTILPSFIQQFGGGGSAAVIINGTPISIGTTAQRYSQTITIPSITGKTVGAGSYLQANLILPPSQTFTVTIADVQVEEGPVATPFERRPVGLELALCQRYYERGRTFYRAHINSASLGAGITAQFRNVKRAVPTVTRSGFTGTNAATNTALSISENQFEHLGVSSGAGLVVWSEDWAADAEL
jgi:hypothetical protein